MLLRGKVLGVVMKLNSKSVFVAAALVVAISLVWIVVNL
jgi:hypothetical protein